ncbi:MAG: MFS transporter [Ktedonobacterales bacterium]
MGTTQRLLPARSPLRRQAYRRLWLGQAASRLGDQFTVIALLWFVLQLTGSGAAVGIVVLCFELPAVLTGPFLGRLLDRAQPRVLMGADNLLRAALIALVPTLSALGVLQLWQVYVIAACAGALSPATLVGVRVMLPSLVPDSELDQANALSSFNLQFAALVGPVVAGILVAALGGLWALLIDAASFVVMGALVLTLPNTPRERRVAQDRREGRWLGFGALFAMKDVRALTLLSLVFFLSYGPLEVALPVYNQNVLHAGATGYGLLWTGFGAGAVLGALGTPLVARLRRPGVLLAWIAVLWGALLGPLVVLRLLPPAMLFLALAGCAWAPYTAIETTLLQRLIPQRMHGEVFGARSTVTTAAAPLGAVLGGLLLSVSSAPAVIGVSALACVLTGVLSLASPTLRGLRRIDAGSESVPVVAERA